jgi:hypothetical protein
MIYLNLKTSTLRAPEYIGSEPTQRGTWLNLLCYCCEQENGGTIEGCAGWKDRQWQQTAGVTLAEVREECDLWQWDGEALVVTFYPSDKEAEVQSRREAGRLGGKRSGKARRRSKNEAHLEANGEAHLEGVLEAHLERKGKEGNGKECNGREEGSLQKAESTPALAEFLAEAQKIGVEADIATEIWHDNESRPITPYGQWTDYRGNPIAKWQANLSARALQIKSRRGGVITKTHNGAKAKSDTPWEIKQRLEAIQKEMEGIRADRRNRIPKADTPWESTMAPEAVERVKALKATAQELNRKLALSAKEAA